MPVRNPSARIGSTLAILALLASFFARASLPTEIARTLPHAEAAGEGRLTWWGIPVYDARLWVGSGFRQGQFHQHPFALELTYLRALRGADIARRSIEEMQKLASIPQARAQRWGEQLKALVPDVKDGDRITGVNEPGIGAEFLVNGKRAGRIDDPEFARLFFAIWLASGTSEPALRASLLAGTSP